MSERGGHLGLYQVGVALILASIITCAAQDARAADPEALIHEGLELRRAGDDASALKRFQQAYDLNNTPKAMAQIGLCEQALGRWGAADKHLRQAVQAGDDPWIRKFRTAIDEALAVVGDHVGRLDVTGTPAGAEIRVDGESVGRLPLGRPISVTAGGVAIEVRAPGYLPIVRTTTVKVGVLTRETFNLQSPSPSADTGGPGTTASMRGPDIRTDGVGMDSHLPARVSSSAPGGIGPDGTGRESMGPVNPLASRHSTSGEASGMEPPTKSDGVSARRVLTLGAAGLSVVSLAFGIVEHLVWQHKVDSFASMSNCASGLPDSGGQGCKPLYDDGQRAKVLAFVGYGAAAALAATAAILFLTEPSQPTEPHQVACAPTLHTPGVDCALRF